MFASRAIAAASLILVLGAGAFAQELPAGLRTTFDEGVQALKAGNLDAAESAFRAVIGGGGGLAYVHNNLGIALQGRGQHERAVAEFGRAVRLDPDYVAPRILTGASLLALGRGAEATTQLESAVKIAPREPLARMQLARVHEHTGNWIGAVEQYRALKELAPGEPEYAYGLGRAYLRLSEWCLSELHALDSGEARFQQTLGHHYRVQGRPDLALRAFERAVEADPSLPEVHLALAQIHMEQKRWAEARGELDRELALVPESAGARAFASQLRALEADPP